jgi:cold shock protein
MSEGTITKIVADRNFGLIDTEDGEKDLYFHYNEVLPKNANFFNLKAGDRVEFEIQDSPNGPRATRVLRIDR